MVHVTSFILSNNIVDIVCDNDAYFSCGYPLRRALPEQARTDTLSAPSDRSAHKEQAPPCRLRSIQSQSEQLSSLACQRVPLVAVPMATMPRYYAASRPPTRTRPAPPRPSVRTLRCLRRPPAPGAPLSPTSTRAAFLLKTLLAPGAAGPPVADRHSASSASRYAVIRSATPQRDGRDTGDRNACSSGDAAGESHRCERNCASRARREARPHPAAGPRALSPISPGRGSPTLVRVPSYYPP